MVKNNAATKFSKVISSFLIFSITTIIQTLADGAESYTYTFNRTREIPCLPRNDPVLVERSWNGLTLTNLSFTSGRDGLYTATAVYPGTNTIRRTVSYITTAIYCGVIDVVMPGNTLYTMPINILDMCLCTIASLEIYHNNLQQIEKFAYCLWGKGALQLYRLGIWRLIFCWHRNQKSIEKVQPSVIYCQQKRSLGILGFRNVL